MTFFPGRGQNAVALSYYERLLVFLQRADRKVKEFSGSIGLWFTMAGALPNRARLKRRRRLHLDRKQRQRTNSVQALLSLSPVLSNSQPPKMRTAFMCAIIAWRALSGLCCLRAR